MLFSGREIKFSKRKTG